MKLFTAIDGKPKTDLIRDNTPVEEYEIRGKTVYVKRDDLCIPSEEAPALAKLRGVYYRLLELKDSGFTRIGVMDTRISKSGWGVAYLAKHIGGLEVINYYPDLKSYGGGIPDNQQNVLKLGGNVHGLPGGRTAILYHQAKEDLAKIEHSYMLPLGLVVEESVEAIREEAELLDDKYLGGDVVVCVGSGMTILGLALALENKVNKIYGISAGMSNARQIKRIKGINWVVPQVIKLILPPGVDYYSYDNIKTPFRSSPYYDKKAWRWLRKNLKKLKEPILFWNIGV